METENKKIEQPKNKAISSSLRSPKNNLITCLEKIAILFEKNTKNPMTSDAIAADMGLKAGSGSTDSLVASLKYYGLLEKYPSMNNRYKVADFIVNYCLFKTLTKEEIKTCLLSVPVNKKLFSMYDINNCPSENVIKSYLINDCGYSLKEANTYMTIFTQNYLEYKKYFNEEIKDLIVTEIEQSETKSLQLNEPTTYIENNKKNTMRDYTHKLNGNNHVTVQIPENLGDLEEEDLGDIKALLELVLNKVNKQLEK